MTKRKSDPTPRSVIYSTLYNPASPKSPDSVLDRAVVLYFQAPHSYTGEDILELQLHGGNAIVRSVLSALHQLGKTSAVGETSTETSLGLRYAEAGEFSKRAFQNGALDLTQVEGIRDAIDAETETQRQAALAPSSGALKDKYDAWRAQIVDSMALLTALIDFSEDSGDVGESASVLFTQARDKVGGLLAEIRGHRGQIQRSRLIVDGIKLDLLGPPNAGKSFLLNRLAEKEAAIVSDVPGTTRDVLEVPMDIGGYKLVLGDTAGLRKHKESVKSSDISEHSSVAHSAMKIEMEGIRRAKERFKSSDVILAVIPIDSNTTHSGFHDISEEIRVLQEMGKKILVVLNKEDLLGEAADRGAVASSYAELLHVPDECIVLTSCINNTGIGDLVSKIEGECKRLVQSGDSNSRDTPISTSQRVRDILDHEVVAGLENFMAVDDEHDVVIATEELRFAAEGIGKITGQGVGIEEVLGVVFGNFCIGK